MTCTEIVNAAAARLDLTSAEALARLGRHVNTYHKRLTSSLGLQVSRRTFVPADTSINVQTVAFAGVEKIHRIEDRTSGKTRILDEVSDEEIAERTGDTLTAYAIYSTTATGVTIRLNIVPSTVFSLWAEGLSTSATLAGTDEPSFPESFHDILIAGAVYEERLKQEKPQLAQLAKLEYEDRAGDLRLFIAKSAQQDIFQGKRRHGSTPGATTSGGGGSSLPDPVTVPHGGTGRTTLTNHGVVIGQGSASVVVTTPGTAGQVLVSGGPSADPSFSSIGVAGGGTGVATLVDRGVVIGRGTAPVESATGAANTLLHGNGAGANPSFSAVVEADLALTDVTTNNVSSTKHGFAPKSPANAAQFLNGASTPAFAAVKDSDLSTSDITTNNVSTTKHGFTPKLPNDDSLFLDGKGNYTSPAGAAAGLDILQIEALLG